jgi:two-component system, OmpR family, sensor histidine kinase VanS
MKTIKAKLFLFFMISIVAFAALSILLNLLFLEKFYIYRNKDIFASTRDQIVTAYRQKPDSILDVISQIDRMDGISCIISDRDMMIEFSSFPLKQDKDNLKLPSELEQLVRSYQALLKSSSLYTTVDTTDAKVREIVLITAIGSDSFLILRKPVKWIIESASIANEFLLYTGLLILGAGGIFIYLLAKRMARPIVQMSKAAKSIAALNFDEHVDVHAHDEIGMLGQSINLISEKLSRSIDTLKQDVERRKLLVRNLSHDLKTPIGVIKGYTEGLQFGLAEDKDRFNRYCSIIKEECDRMDGMIQELLELSKLESGAFKMVTTSFLVRELIDTIVERFTPVLNEAGISISVACDPDLSMEADRVLMDRLLSNYLSNAIHHAECEKAIIIEAKLLSGKLRLSVQNTGQPVSEDALKKIWDVFYKVDMARSRQYGGHGLGLSIVKTIAELHGGSCSCENVPDGIRFFVEIPHA